MAKEILRRRGTTAEHSSFIGAIAETTIDTDKNVVVVHDGSTAGGFPLALESAIPSGTIGKHTVWIPAGGMRPTISNGCAILAEIETTAGSPDINALDFDTAADEHAQFSIAFPKSWDEGTITYTAFWTSTAVGTTGVAWALQGLATANDDNIDTPWSGGTPIVVTDDNISAAEDCLITAESAALTVAGTPAAGELCHFRIFRDVSDANDDMTEDARLIGIQLFFTIDAGTDD